MLVPHDEMQIFVALHPVDMRKAVNGLIQEIINTHQDNPQSGHLYIFRNRKSDLIKAVFWHIDGFVLIQKRLEQHKFKFPKRRDETLRLNKTQLKWLLSGFDFMRIADAKGPQFTDYF